MLQETLSFARICVEITADQVLPNMIPIYDENQLMFEQRVEYEWIPPRCPSCKLFGHNNNGCGKQKETNPQQKWKVKAVSSDTSLRAAVNSQSGGVGHDKGGSSHYVDTRARRPEKNGKDKGTKDPGVAPSIYTRNPFEILLEADEGGLNEGLVDKEDNPQGREGPSDNSNTGNTSRAGAVNLKENHINNAGHSNTRSRREKQNKGAEKRSQNQQNNPLSSRVIIVNGTPGSPANCMNFVSLEPNGNGNVATEMSRDHREEGNEGMKNTRSEGEDSQEREQLHQPLS